MMHDPGCRCEKCYAHYEAGRLDAERDVVAYLIKLSEDRDRVAKKTGNPVTAALACDARALASRFTGQFDLGKQP